MSDATQPTRVPRTGIPVGPGTRARRAADLVMAEWIKVRSLPVTWWMVAGALVAAIGIGALATSFDVRDWDQMTGAQRAGLDPLADSFIGFLVSQLVFASLGVLAVTNEYSSGLIRTTFTAMPARTGVLVAKAVVVGALTGVTGLLGGFASFGVGQAVLSQKRLGLSIADPGALRAVLATVGYLVAVSLIGLGLGVLLRRTAPAVMALVTVLFLGPELLHGSAAWMTNIANSLPGNAIRRLVSSTIWSGAPSISHAVIVIVAYPMVVLAVAAIVLRHRDA